ncbi:hypothetical protein BpHYR1_012763 [Brachionus plicatilis]|uniref:Uncharacterized protein n=1 Tax=Brachionus plicatilis TaxID=10195 RepID=A0A3M7STW0_BRAPC|nr:hypothetical protein BpHYR1_012763 [Brachionus plicatilis]
MTLASPLWYWQIEDLQLLCKHRARVLQTVLDHSTEIQFCNNLVTRLDLATFFHLEFLMPESLVKVAQCLYLQQREDFYSIIRQKCSRLPTSQRLHRTC